MATPEELLAKLDDIANGVDDHGGISVRDVVADIIQDICNSYDLAIGIKAGEGWMSLQTATDIRQTVRDYIANHYGDD